jgi:hypothetical protein
MSEVQPSATTSAELNSGVTAGWIARVWAITERWKANPTATAVVATFTGLGVLLWCAWMLSPLDKRIIDYYPFDVAAFMLAAKSLLQGPALYVDQLTPIGPWFFYPIVWGMQWFGAAGAALNFSILLAGTLMALLCVAAAPGRLSPLSAAVLAATAVLITLQPANLGDDATQLSVAMQYNKAGFAALLILFVILGLPARARRAYTTLEIALLTLVLLCCFFTKITFFVVAVVASLLSVLMRSGTARATPLIAVGLALVAIALAPEHGAYLHAIIFSGFQSGHARTDISAYIDLLVGNGYLIAISLLAAVFTASLAPRSPLTYAAVLAIILGGSFAALSQNAQDLLLPSAAAVFIIFFEWSLSPLSSANPAVQSLAQNQPHQLSLLRLTAILFLVWYPVTVAAYSCLPLSSYASLSGKIGTGRTEIPIGNMTKGLVFDPVRTTRFLSTIAAAGRIASTSPDADQDLYIADPGAWFATLADAAALMKRAGVRGGTAFTFDKVNGPALIPGVTASWPWHLWAMPAFKPVDAQATFRCVDLVFIPRYPSEFEITRRLLRFYNGFVRSHYRVVAESRFWTICGRAPAGPPPDHRPCVPAEEIGSQGEGSASSEAQSSQAIDD